MGLKIKADLTSRTAHSAGNVVATSINGVLPDSNGNVDIEFDGYMSGDTGDTLIFKEQNKYKMSKLVTVAFIITLDAELEQCKNEVLDGIFDARNGDVWVLVNGVWELDSRTLYEVLDKGTIYTNPFTKRAFLINANNTVEPFSGTSKGTALGQVPGVEQFASTADGTTLMATQHYPSGLIVQNISGTSDSTGKGVITLPQALSTKILTVMATPAITTTNTLYDVSFDLTGSSLSAVSFVTKRITAAGIAPTSITFNAIVIGY